MWLKVKQQEEPHACIGLASIVREIVPTRYVEQADNVKQTVVVSLW